MEIRVYKDGAKTGKTTKLIIAGAIIALIIAISAYGLFTLRLPFLEVQTFTIISVFLTGISTFGKFKGLPLWQFFFLALKFRLKINRRTYKVERMQNNIENKKEKISTKTTSITRKSKNRHNKKNKK